MSNDFDSILNYDPLLEAEKLTGKSYKEDDQTSALGLLMHMEHGRRKREELALRGDTYWGMPYAEAMDIFLGQGFVPVWGYSFEDRGAVRQACALWCDGLLLVVDEYEGTLNTAKLEFNWTPLEGHPWSEFFRLPISGGMEHRSEGFDDVEGDPWVGVADIDVREGFVHLLAKLRASGVLLTTWYITDDLLAI